MTGHDHRTVLAIEDDKDLLELLATVLDDAGYHVRTARNGREGLGVLDELTPDIILLDMKMPVMNGWDFAETLAARPGPHPPLVVVTAAEDARQRAVEVGADGWVGKPFDLDVLLGEIERHLRTRELVPAATRSRPDDPHVVR